MGSTWDGDSEGMAVRNESGKTEVSRWLGTKLMWWELVFVSSSSHECKQGHCARWAAVSFWASVYKLG